MTKLLSVLLAIVGALVIVVLSVDNRQMADLVFWPLPFSFQLPLYAVFLIGLVGGVLWVGRDLALGERPAQGGQRPCSRVRKTENQEKLNREREEREVLEQARRRPKIPPSPCRRPEETPCARASVR